MYSVKKANKLTNLAVAYEIWPFGLYSYCVKYFIYKNKYASRYEATETSYPNWFYFLSLSFTYYFIERTTGIQCGYNSFQNCSKLFQVAPSHSEKLTKLVSHFFHVGHSLRWPNYTERGPFLLQSIFLLSFTSQHSCHLSVNWNKHRSAHIFSLESKKAI